MTLTLRPSKAHIWTRCGAAPTFESAAPPRPDTDPAREGTCAAWVADCVLKGDAGSCEEMLGETHANGWLVDEEMVFYVQAYVNMIRERGGVTTTEQEVFLTPEIKGTLDSSTSFEGGSVLCVDDLKYGFKIVEPVELPQLIIYGAAEYNRLVQRDPKWAASITHVRLGIYQPRAFHTKGIYRTWTVSVQELAELAGWIIERGALCLVPEPIATPGEQCENCNANTSCFAFLKSLGHAYHVLEDTTQRRLTGEELARQWRFVKMFKKLLEAHDSALDAETDSRLRAGENVPGVAITPTYGHRKFIVPEHVVAALTGKDVYKQTLKTPAELEREGVPKTLMESLAKTPVVGHKVREFKGKDIAKAFQNSPL